MPYIYVRSFHGLPPADISVKLIFVFFVGIPVLFLLSPFLKLEDALADEIIFPLLYTSTWVIFALGLVDDPQNPVHLAALSASTPLMSAILGAAFAEAIRREAARRSAAKGNA